MNNIPHYHSDFELIYVNRGNAIIAVNEKSFNITSSHAVFINSNDIHYIRSDKNAVLTVFKASENYFESIFGEKELVSPLLSKTNDIIRFLTDIEAELKFYDRNSGFMATALTAQLLIKISRCEQTQDRERKEMNNLSVNELYSKIHQKISCEYSTVTFKELAKQLHFSEPYFSKIFHKLFGMTFTQYLNTVKTAAAIEMLKDGNKRITEISELCGFNTLRNFNKVFKEFTGHSPSNLPPDYVFLYKLKKNYGLDPTLNCTEIIE